MPDSVVARLTRYGVWLGAPQVTPGLAAELERLGYGALWVGGSPPGDLRLVEELLDATTTLTLATSIVNVWQDDAATVAASFARIQARHPGRFLLGIGIGHREATREYASPYDTLAAYTGELRERGVPEDSLVLAALGPRVLRLARDETAGANPYLVTPEHTARARQILGRSKLLAPEQKVVLETDPGRARAIGRPRVQRPYLGLSNYVANLRRLGWSEADLTGGGSDALIDALVYRGSPGEVADQLAGHLTAGADHVAVQLLTGEDGDLANGFATLAGALEPGR